jgi:hypothetical protein
MTEQDKMGNIYNLRPMVNNSLYDTKKKQINKDIRAD